jgi:hypothetical protein
VPLVSESFVPTTTPSSVLRSTGEWSLPPQPASARTVIAAQAAPVRNVQVIVSPRGVVDYEGG